MADIDHFRASHGSYGPLAGDNCLDMQMDSLELGLSSGFASLQAGRR
ncbi:hypothetical protein OU995_02030 [Roseateles sp. SL47]|nr:hypothetical protein [Roseateles sp. SL47]WAC73553.1 hypothetical protein OU995_02030 [Roseateles sp. SL47]